MIGIETVKSLELHWKSLVIRKVAVKLIKYSEVFSVWGDRDILVSIRRRFNICKIGFAVIIKDSTVGIDPGVY